MASIKLFGATIAVERPVRRDHERDHDHDLTTSKVTTTTTMTTSSSSSSSSSDQVAEGDRTKKPDKIIPCPRCKSMETKFCYFNNYNVNQPRHFCRGCQRYWTAGGALRNVPVGAGRRKSKPPTPTPHQPSCAGDLGHVVAAADDDDDFCGEDWRAVEQGSLGLQHQLVGTKRRRTNDFRGDHEECY